MNSCKAKRKEKYLNFNTLKNIRKMDYKFGNLQQAQRKKEAIEKRTGSTPKVYRKGRKSFMVSEGRKKDKDGKIVFGREFDHGKPIDFGKALDFGKKVDFGKTIDLGKELDFGV